MTQQSGYNSKDWRVAVIYGEGRFCESHYYGKIALSDRGIQSACGKVRDVDPRTLLQAHPENRLCNECARIMYGDAN